MQSSAHSPAQASELEVERQLSSERVYSGHFLNINRDTVGLPNGQHTIREYVVHPGACMIIPLRADGAVLMERQFRYPLHKTFVEFPAGKLDPGETALMCAKRELLEETGYSASDTDWHYLAPIHNAIAYADEVIHLFLANNVLDTGMAAPQGSEVWMSTFWAQPQDVMSMVRSGELTDVKTVIGAFWLDKIMRGEWRLGELLTTV